MSTEPSYRLLVAICMLTVVSVVCPAFLMADDLGARQGTQCSPYLQWNIDNPAWAGNPFDVLSANQCHGRRVRRTISGLNRAVSATFLRFYRGEDGQSILWSTSQDNNNRDG